MGQPLLGLSISPVESMPMRMGGKVARRWLKRAPSRCSKARSSRGRNRSALNAHTSTWQRMRTRGSPARAWGLRPQYAVDPLLYFSGYLRTRWGNLDSTCRHAFSSPRPLTLSAHLGVHPVLPSHRMIHPLRLWWRLLPSRQQTPRAFPSLPPRLRPCLSPIPCQASLLSPRAGPRDRRCGGLRLGFLRFRRHIGKPFLVECIAKSSTCVLATRHPSSSPVTSIQLQEGHRSHLLP
mmetsp:Transcript_18205/g.54910  ORF Transcript_18205/g.54910 Transcript_18205/m.54910 type:complete len:236 (-) Transcript_18205:133-840(-)